MSIRSGATLVLCAIAAFAQAPANAAAVGELQLGASPSKTGLPAASPERPTATTIKLAQRQGGNEARRGKGKGKGKGDAKARKRPGRGKVFKKTVTKKKVVRKKVVKRRIKRNRSKSARLFAKGPRAFGRAPLRRHRHRYRDRNKGPGLVFGVAAGLAAAIIAAEASKAAGDHDDYGDYVDESGPVYHDEDVPFDVLCQRWIDRCDAGDGFACKQFYTECDW